jgi:RHS repeat-associated protein
MSGAGSTVLEGSATSVLDGPANDTEFDPWIDGRTLTNDGVLTLRSGELLGGDGATIDNAGTFNVNAEDQSPNYSVFVDGLVWDPDGPAWIPGPAPLLVNTGTVAKAAGTGVTQVGWPIDNEASVDAQSGQLDLVAGGTSGRSSSEFWSAGSGASVAFSAGSFSLGAESSLSGPVSVQGASVTAGELNGSGELSISSGVLEVDGPGASSVDSLALSGGSLSGSGVVDVSGSLDWSGGEMSRAGSVVLLESASSLIDGPAGMPAYLEPALGGGTLVNEGSLTLASGQLEGSAGAVLDNVGTLALNTEDRDPCCSAFLDGLEGQAFLMNTGTLEKASGIGVTQVNWAIDNEGFTDAQTGQLDFTGGGTSGLLFADTWTSSPQASIAFGAGSYTLGSSSLLSGNAVVDGADVTADQVSASSVSISSGSLEIDGPSNADSATVTGSFYGPYGFYNTGSLVVDSARPLTVQSLLLGGPGGSISGSGDVHVAGSFNWTGGAISGAGSVVLLESSSGTIAGSSGTQDYLQPTLAGGTLVNDGSLTLASGQLEGSAGAVLDNVGTLALNTEDRDPCCSTFLDGLEGTALLANTGTLEKTAGTGVTQVAWPIDNEGSVDAQSGQLNFLGGDPSAGGMVDFLFPLGGEEGSWSAGSGDSIAFSGGSYELGSGISMTGTIDVDGANVGVGYIDGNSAHPPDVTLNSGDLDFATTGGESVFHSFTLNGGMVNGGGTVAALSSFTWTDGEFNGGGGVFELGAGGTGTIAPTDGAAVGLYGWALQNAGTLTVPSGQIVGGDGAQIDNTSSFVVNSEDSDGALVGDGTAGLYNTGLVEKTAGTGTTLITWPYENAGAGSVAQDAGTLTLSGPKSSFSPYQGGNPGPPNAAEPDFEPSCSGDPVDCANGNMFTTETDLSAGGPGIVLQLQRTYNSQAAALQTSPGPFGYGWTSSFSDHLQILANGGVVTVDQANGSAVQFGRTASGSYSAPPLVQATLTQNAGGSYTYTLPNGYEMQFSSTGQLTSESDRNGNTISLSYNGAGQMTSISDAAGHSITLHYNSAGQVDWASDPSDTTVHYFYTNGDLTEVSYPATSAGTENLLFAYYANNTMSQSTDPNGNTTHTYYDSQNRVHVQTDAMNRTRTWNYLPGGETQIVNPNNDVEDEWFSNGEPTEIINDATGPQPAVTQYVYDASGDMTSMTDPNNNTWSYTYGGAGNRTSVTNPAGNTTRYTYDSARDVTSIRTPEGKVTSIVYNAGGEPTSVSRTLDVANGPNQTQLTASTYYSDGELETVTDPDHNTSSFTYDDLGDVRTATDAQGNESSWTYDADGRERTATSPKGNLAGANAALFTTTYTRDQLGRVTAITDPLGDQTQIGYDQDGNVVSETDPNNQAANTPTTTKFDADNEPELVTYPDHTTQSTVYDAAGDISTQTDPNNQTTTYYRNALGEAYQITGPMSRTSYYTYYPNGSVETAKDPAGRTTTYIYNPSEQLTNVDYSDGTTPDVTYGYDADGQETSMADGTGDSTYSYDSLGRLTSTTDGAGASVGYGYDLANNQTSVTYPGGQTVQRGFDSDENLKSVTDWLDNETQFSYDPNGNLQTTTFAGSASQSDGYVYNDADELTASTTTANGATVASIAYPLIDADGNVKQETSAGLGASTQNYGYNSLDELTADNAGTSTYDADGNPERVDGAPTQTYNAADELTSGPGGSYSYNSLGERTTQTPTTGTPTGYTWDQAGDLTGETGGPSNTTLSYGYDGGGLLQSTTAAGNTTQLTWDGSSGTSMLLQDGSTSYIYGPGGLPLEQIGANNTPVYYHHDQLGSTRLLTTAAGTPLETISYSAFGASTITSGTASTPLLYAGTYTDPTTGLIYMQARWYDPATAQFISVDPLQAVTGQTYAYAGDNPISNIDPTGTDLIQVGLAAVGAVDAGITDAGCGATLEIPGVDDLACGAAAEADTTEAEILDNEATIGGASDAADVGDATGEDEVSCEPSGATEEGAAELQTFYPPNGGFSGSPETEYLQVGEQIDRYGGDESSRYFSPEGTPEGERSLPPGTSGQPLNTYVVAKPFPVESGPAASWFDSLGGGTQYRTPVPFGTLLDRGILEEAP